MKPHRRCRAPHLVEKVTREQLESTGAPTEVVDALDRGFNPNWPLNAYGEITPDSTFQGAWYGMDDPSTDKLVIGQATPSSSESAGTGCSPTPTSTTCRTGSASSYPPLTASSSCTATSSR